MYRDNAKQFSFNFIFIMLLYIIIVILSIGIISLGKNIYDNINEDRNTNYELRVSLSYIANKIRQSDKEGTIEIRSLHNRDALLINEVYDGESYETWIYFYEDGLYEMFTDEGASFELSDGMKIVDVDEFRIDKIKNNLYKFTAESNNTSSALYITLYSN
ncbi:MAG TPA: DUF4860 domain-containing protein [Tissierellia bacterium]|nr:DUF4860 domain-containing protein [Tissierellia bacterium]